VASPRGKWHELDREGKVGFGKMEWEQVVFRHVTDPQRSWRRHHVGSLIQARRKQNTLRTEQKHELSEVIWLKCDAIGEMFVGVRARTAGTGPPKASPLTSIQSLNSQHPSSNLQIRSDDSRDSNLSFSAENAALGKGDTVR
jgi:hypothetical protein